MQDAALRASISRQINVPATRLFDNTRFADDLYLDQLDLTLLIVSLESRLNLFLTDEEASRIETFGDMRRVFGTRNAA